MPLKLYTSNRLEDLAGRVTLMLAAAPQSPLVAETIIVQSRGMARWLAMRLAAGLGAWANGHCPFPNAFMLDMLKDILPEDDRQNLSREVMTWRLLDLLDDMLSRPAFAPIRNYLAAGGERKRFQLALRIADLFDQYAIYRPEMMIDWQEGRGEGWQAEIWQRLMTEDIGGVKYISRATLMQDCLARLGAADFDSSRLPARLSIFGVSSLPPYHLRFFAALGQHLEVNFFLLNPCQEYWGDIVSERRAGKISIQAGVAPEELYLDCGNSLLAAMGDLGREFFGQLNEFAVSEEESFAEPLSDRQETNLLAAIQDDILHLRQTAKITKFPDNPGLSVHSCHSPMREIEVLHDQLLARLQDHPDISPRDIVVMTPDIEVYGPLIQAVFDRQEGAAVIPFSIADRSLRLEGNLLAVLQKIIGLAGSRFTASQVLEIIECPVVYQRFELCEDDLGLIRRWINDSGIRWGLDGENRCQLGLPEVNENTWRAGLDRLLLAYAMQGDGRQRFAGIMPYEYMEGDAALTLGKFIDCLDGLFEWAGKLAGSYSLGKWGEIFISIMDDCFLVDDDGAAEAQFMRSVFVGLDKLAEQAAFTGRVGLDVMRCYLDRALETESFSSGFLARGVTFCEMLPMRAIPFKMVCLLGMGDDYPRSHIPVSFDLMAQAPKPGDRSRRNDDRYLFLEALISARQELYISYVGQSIKDGSSKEPSVLVSELLEYIAAENDTLAVTRHPLQPFSERYFQKGSDLISFSQDNFQAAANLGREKAPKFLGGGALNAPAASARHLDLSALIDFFAHPARYFCKNRLAIYDCAADEVLADDEPFALAGLDKYLLNTEFLASMRDGRLPADSFANLQARGILPHAALGRVEFLAFERDLAEVKQKLEPYLTDRELADLAIDLEIDDFTVSGTLSDIKSGNLLQFRCAKVAAKDLLALWLRHIILNIIAPAGYPRQSILVGSDKIYVFAPVDNGRALLTDLLQIYWQGQGLALPFYPKSSLVYAEGVDKGADAMALQAKVNKTWLGDEHTWAESDDYYYRLCFANEQALGGEFAELSCAIFTPLLAARDGEA